MHNIYRIRRILTTKKNLIVIIRLISPRYIIESNMSTKQFVIVKIWDNLRASGCNNIIYNNYVIE